MAKTQDIARHMAQAPMAKLESTSPSPVETKGEETVVLDAPAVEVKTEEKNPLRIAGGYGLPEFSSCKAGTFTDPKTSVVTVNLCNVTVQSPIPGIIHRFRVQRRWTPATENGLTGHAVETSLQLPSIARGSIQGFDAITPEADSKLSIWRYMVVQAAERWLDTRGENSSAIGASSSTPRLIKFVPAAKPTE